MTATLVTLAVLVSLMAGGLAWHHWRTHLREEEERLHGYGPPPVIFPPRSKVEVVPATSRRLTPPSEAVATPGDRPLRRRAVPAIADDDPPDAQVADAADAFAAALPERAPSAAASANGRVGAGLAFERVRVGAPRPSATALLDAPEATAPTVALDEPGGTLRMLPGRLVVVEGDEPGREIRFVQLGQAMPTVSLGRAPGRPYEHVQLRAPTVSRQHARLTRADGRWRIENTSRTNPLVVNGQGVAVGSAPLPLADGDLIELGEVTCRFHDA